jgi:hypothetical protein
LRRQFDDYAILTELPASQIELERSEPEQHMLGNPRRHRHLGRAQITRKPISHRTLIDKSRAIYGECLGKQLKPRP